MKKIIQSIFPQKLFNEKLRIKNFVPRKLFKQKHVSRLSTEVQTRKK